MNSPANPLKLSREEVRRVDAIAINDVGIPGIVLMENAGRGCTDLLLSQDLAGSVAICCGKGNNGGDGFVIARHLERREIPVTVLLFASPNELQGDALINFRILQACQTPMLIVPDPITDNGWKRTLQESTWIVDALLGTGTQGELRAPFPEIIEAINSAGSRILAIDLPSGLDCDTGKSLGTCVQADKTATFVAEKKGFAAGASFTGDVHVIDIGVPTFVIDQSRDQLLQQSQQQQQ